MSNNFDLNAVQNAVGHVFRDPTLIQTAFTHFSAVQNAEKCNTMLIFLGQRLLDLMISDHICRDLSACDEKELNRRLDSCRSSLGYENYLSEHALTDNIILSDLSEALRNSSLIHGEVFLAILGAIYRDGGMPSLKSFLLPMIRLSDGSSRYMPKPSTAQDNERFDAPSKQKTAEKGKKGIKMSMVSEAMKFFTKSKKTAKTEESKPTTETKPTAEAKVKETPVSRKKKETSQQKDDKTEKKTFIRDALQPVSLPESMKTKPSKPEKKAEAAPKKQKPKETPKTKAVAETDTNNYKSMLQEFIQKNMHSANVLLKYNTSSPEKNKSVTEVTLDGNKLADGEGANKRASEREAAKNAYLAITNKRSKLYKWFSSLNGGSTGETAAVKEDYVSKLNRHYQKLSHTSSVPLTYEKRPSEKKNSFTVAIIANGEEIASGTGKNLRDAKQSAAETACVKLGI